MPSYYGERYSYDPHEISQKISRGHAYEKHVVKEGRFTGGNDEKYGFDLFIRSRDDFARHIENTITDPATEAFHAENGRDVYYNDITNTIVIVNSIEQDRGTCYRDRNKYKEFSRLLRTENESRRNNSVEEIIDIVPGGYEQLYPGLLIAHEEYRQAELARAIAIEAAQQVLNAAQAEADRLRQEAEAAEAEREALEQKQREERAALEAAETAKVEEARKQAEAATAAVKETEERERQAVIEAEQAKLEAERAEETRRQAEEEAASRIEAVTEEEAAKVEALKAQEDAKKEALLEAEAEQQRAEQEHAAQQEAAQATEEKLREAAETQADTAKEEETRKEAEAAKVAEADAAAKEQQAAAEVEKAKLEVERAEEMREQAEKDAAQRINTVTNEENAKLDAVKEDEITKKDILDRTENIAAEAHKNVEISNAEAIAAENALMEAERSRDNALADLNARHDAENQEVTEKYDRLQQALSAAEASVQDRKDMLDVTTSEHDENIQQAKASLEEVEAANGLATPTSQAETAPQKKQDLESDLSETNQQIVPEEKEPEATNYLDAPHPEPEAFTPQPPDGLPTKADDRMAWAYDQIVDEGKQATPEQMEEIRQIANAQFQKEKDELQNAVEDSNDKETTDRIELRAAMENADQERADAEMRAEILKSSSHASSPEVLTALDESESAAEIYDNLENEWGRRAVFDDNYQPIDDDMKNKVDEIRGSPEFSMASSFDKEAARSETTNEKNSSKETSDKDQEKSDKQRAIEDMILEAFPDISGEALSTASSYVM